MPWANIIDFLYSESKPTKVSNKDHLWSTVNFWSAFWITHNKLFKLNCKIPPTFSPHILLHILTQCPESSRKLSNTWKWAAQMTQHVQCTLRFWPSRATGWEWSLRLVTDWAVGKLGKDRSYRSLVVMQTIPVHSNANEFCPVENLNFCKKFSTGLNLVVPLLTKRLAKSLTCLFYTCKKKVMFLTFLKNSMLFYLPSLARKTGTSHVGPSWKSLY